jgi:hypothetical protein
VRVLREYSVAAINAAFAEWRSRASTVITGMWSGARLTEAAALLVRAGFARRGRLYRG